MSDFTLEAPSRERPAQSLSPRFLVYAFFKRLFDLLVSLLLLPVLAVLVLLLLVLNPFLNPGPLFFVQKRMGLDCRPFKVIKFRTMLPAAEVVRRADDPLELDRITPLGHLMRKTRIDEVPQILNVLRGEMSLIGPRPDAYDHALVYLEQVPGYRRRHTVRPGISGLAQTRVGYVQGISATRRKVRADLAYISRAGFRIDTLVLVHTLRTVLTRAGS